MSDDFATWVDGKRRQVTYDRPVSIQDNIARLSAELATARGQLQQLHNLIEQRKRNHLVVVGVWDIEQIIGGGS